MASLTTIPIGSVKFYPVVHASGFASRGGRRVNCGCRSLQSTPAARYEMAMFVSIVALPATGRTVAFIRVPKVRFRSLSSSSRSLIRCNAESAQNDDQQQQPGSPSLGTEFVEKRGSSALAAEDRKKQDFQRLKEDVQMRRKNFWSDLKDQHVVYNRDRDQWGLGLSPIFTVHEDEEGNRFQVDVNEDEVLCRSGVDPNMPQFADEECKLLAEERIELAKGHARDIQVGLVKPSPFSVLYQYKQEASSTSSFRDGSWPGSSLTIPAGAPWQFLTLLIPLLSFALSGFLVRWLLARRQDKDPIAHEKNMRLMQMRKLKAQMRRESSGGTFDSTLPTQQEHGDNGVVNRALKPGEEEVQNPNEVFGEIVEDGLSRVNDDNFQRKVVEIQAMAQNARLQEQESAEARSAESFERKKFLETEMKERIRVKRLENLAKDLDDVRRLGAENSDGPDLMPNAVEVFEVKRDIPAVENGQSSTSEIVSEGTDNYSSKDLGSDSLLRFGTLPLRFKPNPKSTSMKPRIILSAEEARARIASKRARSNASSSSKPEFRRSKIGFGQSNNDFEKVQPSAVESPTSTNSNDLERSVYATSLSAEESSKVLVSGILDTSSDSGIAGAGVSNDCQPEASSTRPTEKVNNSVTVTNEPSSKSENVNIDYQDRTKAREPGNNGRERGQLKSKDEAEEMEWMRDDVLREIVFKVQANEDAGREPFYNLNSEQETLFFKGLERKFEREGDQVKKWIKDRVENIDYGSNGISVYDTPESYELKWKEGVDKSPNSEFYDRFSQDRQRIINEKRGLAYTSPPVSEELPSTDSTEESRLLSSPAPSSLSSTTSPLPVSHTSPPHSKDLGTMHGRSRGKLSGDCKKKVVIASSPRAGESTGPYPSTSPGTQTGEAGKENWDHTKRWAKDLERKYAMETDPATRALMREIGQDLERWITEDEIEAASKMLDNGIEGEEEYVKLHYERTKDKIKRQREIFGRDAMLNKYSEYKEEAEEVELWWLNLPFVVCIGLRATVEGEVQTGLYSVDVAPALDGVAGLSNVPYRTVAFQDRGDAQNFCTLVNSQPEKLSADGAMPVPFDPKDLYKDAKSEGFKVTVIKKGQLQLSVDKPFDEVESRIIELGSAKYFEELLSDRVIDMGSVLDDGLGFGRGPK